MRICVFTAIMGEYDKLIDQRFHSSNVDYICYTNSDLPVESNWLVYKQPKKAWVSDRLQARFIKTSPNFFLPPNYYDFTIWIDGNVELLISPEQLCSMMEEGQILGVFPHQQRDCVFDEIEACRKLQKDSQENLDAVEQFYGDLDWPKNAGLFDSGIVVRREHPSPRDSKELWAFNRQWSFCLLKLSVRDQLSIPYLLSCHFKDSSCSLPSEKHSSTFKRKLHKVKE